MTEAGPEIPVETATETDDSQSGSPSRGSDSQDERFVTVEKQLVHNSLCCRMNLTLGSARMALHREQARLLRGETRRVLSRVAQLEEEADTLEHRAREKREMVLKLLTELESRGKRVFRVSPI